MQKNLQQLLEDLILWLKYQRQAGIDEIPIQILAQIRQIDMAKEKKNIPSKGPGDNLSSIKTLSQLQTLVEQCELCELARTRGKVVFGEGNPSPILMIIGEAPGREEDIQGRPFVGRSGELLTKMLRAININRKEVFITSVIKCRPPGNRTPSKKEINTCMPYLTRQIELLCPSIILCLGGIAAQSLLNVTKSLSSLRGKFYDLNGIKVTVTYHPAYLLRFGGMKQKDLKRKAWHDLQMLQAEYEKYKKKTG